MNVTRMIIWLLLALVLLSCGPTPEEPTPLPSPTPAPTSAVPPTLLPYPDATPHGLTPEPTAEGTPYPPVVPSAAPTSEQPSYMLYFLSDRGGQVDIWRIDPLEGAPEQVTNDEDEERWPALSPGGEWLAYVVLEEAQVSIHLMNLVGGTVRTVGRSGSAALLERPTWWDRTTLLYAVRISAQERELYRAEVDADARPLLVSGAPDGSVLLDWSAASGLLVVVVGVPGESSDLYATDITPEGQIVLGELLGQGFSPRLSADGRYLAYQAPPYDDDPAGFILDLSTGDEYSYNQDEPGRRWDHDLAWAPDYAAFVFVRSSWAWTGEDGRPFYVGESAEPGAVGGTEGLFFAEEIGARQLTQVGYDTAPVLAPTSPWVAFVSNRDDFGRSDIWLLELASAEARVLVGEGGDDWAPFWGPR